MAKYCANCGTNLPQGAQFCPGCGQSATQTREETPEQRPATQRPGGSRLLIGLGVLCAVLVVGLTAIFAYPLLTSGDAAGEAEPAAQDPEPEPTPESGSNKQDVAVEEGSLRDLVQDQVGDFELQWVDEMDVERAQRLGEYREFVVEGLHAGYVGPGGDLVDHALVTMRSPEAADNLRQEFKMGVLSEGSESEGLEIVADERPVEASGRQVGTLTVIRESGKEVSPYVLWNNGNLFAVTEIEGESDDAERFYESAPY